LIKLSFIEIPLGGGKEQEDKEAGRFGNNAEYVEFHNQPIELKGLAEPE
jgi:hypothetical protein